MLIHKNFRLVRNEQGDCTCRGATPQHLFTVVDFMVYLLLVGFGALQFGLYLHSNDFFTGDTTYFELMRSIVEGRAYGFDFKRETLLPPGFPALLASLCVTVGCSYSIFVRAMAVCATLGFLVSYELLRREQGRAVAAVACLLLDSSPLFFAFSTRSVISDVPYFFTSMLTLLLVTRIETAQRSLTRSLLWLLCGVSLISSQLIRSSGIALLIGLVAWLLLSCFFDRAAVRRRLRTFLPLLFLGVIVQGYWMHWSTTREVQEWPVGGYPQSYLSQLRVKNGNNPELGMASLRDIPARVAQNLLDRELALIRLLTPKEYIAPAWASPLIVAPLVLVLIGIGCSLYRTGGGLLEWYFLSQEAMYLLWPWNFEIRFFLPVTPLACLYLWRGGEALLTLFRYSPRVTAACILPLMIFLDIDAGIWAWGSRHLQPVLAIASWTFGIGVAIGIVWMNTWRLPGMFDVWRQRLQRLVATLGQSRAVWRVLGIATIAMLVGIGIDRQLDLGRENLTFDITHNSAYPDIEAAQWIHANTVGAAVVMARQLDVVYHYSQRKVVWFPPLSDPQVLLEGIQKYGVNFIIVHDRIGSYWLPREQDCFAGLLRTYPGMFQMVYEGHNFKIFAVPSDSDRKISLGNGQQTH